MRCFAILPPVILLGACPPDPMCISTAETSAKKLVVDVGRGRDCSKAVRVREVTVRRTSDGHELWRGFVDRGVSLSRVVYGSPQLGGAPEPLVPGTEVAVRVKSVLGERASIRVVLE